MIYAFFSLGIGNSVSHNLVESVARTGNGYDQFITNNERMDKSHWDVEECIGTTKDYKITSD